ncbi:MAG: MATE family efflux transporter [Rhabdochlamydiaceae bacterium]
MAQISASKSICQGTFKELVRLFLPILLMTFSSSFFIFLQKVFFARISPETMEAAVNVTYICRIFQFPCILLAMMAQVYVGRAYGAQDWKSIGPIVWQFIWFSILSMFITVPGCLIYGHYYLGDTAIELAAKPYFHALVAMNFIFPLGAALSCFFIGRGYTRWVLICKLGSELLTFILAYFLILGNSWIPPLGLKGGAISLFVGNAAFCILLLIFFLHQRNNDEYNTRAWRFKPKLFWESIQPGLIRGLSGVVNFASWSATALLMTVRGGDYGLVLSIGGSIFLFLSCFGEAMCQSMTTALSQIIGAKKYELIRQAFRSGIMLALMLIVLISIPFIFFSTQLCHFIFPTILIDEIQKIFFGLWVSLAFFILGYIPLSLVLALKDTKFILFTGFMHWIYGYGLMYAAIRMVGISAQNFWLVLGIMHCITLLIYSLRARRHVDNLRLESLIPIKS